MQAWQAPDYSTWQSYPDWLKQLYDECPPRFCPVPSGRDSLLPLYEDVSLAVSDGLQPLRRWQKLAVLVATEFEERNSVRFPIYPEVVVTIARQCGKSWLEIVGCSVDLVALNRNEHSIFMAQSGKDARSMMFNKWLPKIEESALWRLLDVHPNRGNDPNLFSNLCRTRLTVHTGSEAGGHGPTLRQIRADEIWKMSEAEFETSIGAATRAVANSQRFMASTVGDADAEFLNGKIYRGRELLEADVARPALCLIEWSGDEEQDPGDEAVWRQATPCIDEISATGEGITIEKIREEYERDQSPGKAYFRRTALNQIGKHTVSTALNIQLYDEASVEPTELGDLAPPVVVGIDTTLDGSMSSIAIADGEGRVAVTDHERGRRWIVDRLEAAMNNPAAPEFRHVYASAGGLQDVLEELRLRLKLEVRTLSPGEVSTACAAFRDRLHGVTADDLPARGLRILKSKFLRDAVMTAAAPPEKRWFTFERSGPDSILSPLYAATFAVAGVTEREIQPKRPKAGLVW